MSHTCKLRRDSISHLPKVPPSDPWHARLKRRLHKLILVSRDHPQVFKYLQSNANVEFESKRQVKQFPGFIIHPLSKFRKYWNIFVIFNLLMLHQILTSFILGFIVELTDEEFDFFVLLDFAICLVLFIELLLNFRTGHIVTETNEIILDPKAIAWIYLKTFFLDLINCLPFTLLYTIVAEEKGDTINGAAVVFMCLVFIFSLIQFSRILFYFSTIPIIFGLTEKGSIVLSLFIQSLYCWHWAACVRHLIPLFVKSLATADPNYLMNWTEPEFRFRKPAARRTVVLDESDFDDFENILLEAYEETKANYTMLNKYTRTMLITLKLVLQSGYGEEMSRSIPDILMTTFLMFCGWIYSTYVFILISNVMVASASSESKFDEISKEIEAFGEAKNLSDELKSRIQTYIKYKYDENYFNEDAIELTTPENLRKEIMMHSCANLVAKVPLFRDLPPSVLVDIVSCLKLEIFFPQDVIIRHGTVGDSMYFIAFGTVAIYSPTGKALGTVVDGAHFGEISLLKDQKRIASIVALEMCEVYKLSQKDFRKVIEPHANLLRRLDQTASDRIKIARSEIQESTQIIT